MSIVVSQAALSRITGMGGLVNRAVDGGRMSRAAVSR
jgi:hypothetical protein